MTLTDLYAQVPVAQHNRIIVHGDRVWLRLPSKTKEFFIRPNGELQQVSERNADPDMDALRTKWLAAANTDARVRVIAEALGLQ